MIPVLYKSTATASDFSKGGIGSLTDMISCKVTERRNAECFMDAEYPIDGLHYSDIGIGRLIKAPAAPQKPSNIFCILGIGYSIEGKASIYAPQIMCLRLSNAILNTENTSYTWTKGETATGDDFADIMAALLPNVQPLLTYCTYTGDEFLEQGESVKIDWGEDHPNMMTVVQAIANALGGEIEWGFNSVHLHVARGVDSGLEIRYGLNMTALDAETDATDYYTGIIPYSGESYGDFTTIGMGGFSFHKTGVVDVSDYMTGDTNVTEAGRAWLNAHRGIKTSIKVEFDADGEANVATNGGNPRYLYLCDTVKVVHPALELSQKEKIVETVFDPLIERYDSLSVGEMLADITDTIAALVRQNKKG